MRRYILGLTLLILGACAGRFDRYNIGIGTMYVGDRLAVERECFNRGLKLTAMQMDVYGCTDFKSRRIYCVEDARVIAHEFCRLSLWSDDDRLCPQPFVDR